MGTGNPTGRQKGYTHPEKVRQRIRAAHLIRRLEQHADGEIELKPAQIKSIEILLNKSLPSLSATEVTNYQDNKREVHEYTDAELQEIIASNAKVEAIK